MTSPAALALRYLEEAKQAARSLAAAKKSSALHDFRVALRRFDTCLRGYQKILGKAAARALRRKFKALAAETNAARDAEVYLAMLDGKGGTFESLTHLLQSQLEREHLEILSQTLPVFFKEAEAAQKKLLKARSAPFSKKVLAKILRRHKKRLLQHMVRARTISNSKELHKTRIAAKRLRYLIEPFKPAPRLKRIQNILGDLHDVQGLSTMIAQVYPRAEISVQAFLQNLKKRERKLFDQFQKERLPKIKLVY